MSAPDMDRAPERHVHTQPRVPTHPLLADYATYVLRSNPVWAGRQGLHGWDGQLGAIGPGAQADYTAELALFLHDFESIEPATVTERLDLAVSRLDAVHRLREMEQLRPWVRVPYLYVEETGAALESALSLGITAPDRGPEILLATLSDIPRYLITARRNLEPAQVPPEYIGLAHQAAEGLRQLLVFSRGYVEHEGSPVLAQMCERALLRAMQSLDDFAGHLSAMRPAADGSWRTGRDYFEHCLRDHLLIDMDAPELEQWGREQVEQDRRALTGHARGMDPSRTWQEQLARIGRVHPGPHELFEAHAEAIHRAREHTVAHHLVSIPEGESCAVDVVPEYLRAGLPIGAMDLAPPWDESLSSRLMVTPIRRLPDGSFDPQQLQENCYAMITASVGHLSYPGLHLQRVHHKQGTAGNASIRRAFASTGFVHGWALYAKDLMLETGYLNTPNLMLHRMRNELWRSARLVVDVGLHAGNLGIDEAVDYLMAQVQLGRTTAEGEVRRCIRHDQPTRSAAQVLGRRRFHNLRARWRQLHPGPEDLAAFHHRVLAYGSGPLRLVEDEVLRGAPPAHGAPGD